MAAYKIVDYVTASDTVAEVISDIEDYLETPYDSTTEVAKLIKVLPDYNGLFKGVVIRLEA